MKIKMLGLVALNCLGLHNSSIAQSDSVTITGQVLNYENIHSYFNAMVVPEGTTKGQFVNQKGQFSIRVPKSQSILIGAYGYKTMKVSVADSTPKSTYHFDVVLSALAYELKQVEIFPARELEQIQAELRKIGYKESDFVLSGVDAAMSPITFLYQKYARRAQQERLAAQLENEFEKKRLLRELLSRYASADIVQLEEDEFDDFVTYCKVPDSFMQNSTQYEFIMYIKGKYESYNAYFIED